MLIAVLVLGSCYQKVGSRILVPGPCYQGLATRSLVPRSWSPKNTPRTNQLKDDHFLCTPHADRTCCGDAQICDHEHLVHSTSVPSCEPLSLTCSFKMGLSRSFSIVLVILVSHCISHARTPVLYHALADILAQEPLFLKFFSNLCICCLPTHPHL